jgi:hypothetical protein
MVKSRDSNWARLQPGKKQSKNRRKAGEMVMRKFKLKTGIAVIAVAASAALPAKADLTFNLDQVYGSLGAVPTGTIFGTVHLAQGVDSHTVNVSVNLNAGNTFVGGGAGFALGFDLAGPPGTGVTINNIAFNPVTSHFTTSIYPPVNGADGTGDWEYNVDYKSPGASGNSPTSLSFNVKWTGGTLSPESFVQNPKGLFFISDIYFGQTGKTGDVAAIAPVPEPTTMIAGALLLLPFGASTMRVLRKKRVV